MGTMDFITQNNMSTGKWIKILFGKIKWKTKYPYIIMADS